MITARPSRRCARLPAGGSTDPTFYALKALSWLGLVLEDLRQPAEQ